MTEHPATVTLLRRLHAGDDGALAALLARDLPWVRAEVGRRMGDELRGRADVDDVVQQALVNVLQHGPRFEAEDAEHYRALLLCIVENTIRKMIRDGRRQKRWAGREEPLPSGSVVALTAGVTQPAAAADRNERRAWLQLALELLDSADREVVLARQWEGRAFAAIGAELGISEEAARKRFERAIARLAQLVARLRSGRVDEVLRR
ncbi:MAG: sigma-70 family RNA polymerase sigma factor [Planctomycetes bacterium]|nr:sigma-70 family RNA polymerase sigma factor [Planctomycetota bacterium]MCB9884087.1 sigma-70 family RNA polymerase sigma factor [Planctomycetota bacterium]